MPGTQTSLKARNDKGSTANDEGPNTKGQANDDATTPKAGGKGHANKGGCEIYGKGGANDTTASGFGIHSSSQGVGNKSFGGGPYLDGGDMAAAEKRALQAVVAQWKREHPEALQVRWEDVLSSFANVSCVSQAAKDFVAQRSTKQVSDMLRLWAGREERRQSVGSHSAAQSATGEHSATTTSKAGGKQNNSGGANASKGGRESYGDNLRT